MCVCACANKVVRCLSVSKCPPVEVTGSSLVMRCVGWCVVCSVWWVVCSVVCGVWCELCGAMYCSVLFCCIVYYSKVPHYVRSRS